MGSLLSTNEQLKSTSEKVKDSPTNGEKTDCDLAGSHEKLNHAEILDGSKDTDNISNSPDSCPESPSMFNVHQPSSDFQQLSEEALNNLVFGLNQDEDPLVCSNQSGG